jgi:hypothetical protein
MWTPSGRQGGPMLAIYAAVWSVWSVADRCVQTEYSNLVFGIDQATVFEQANAVTASTDRRI